MRFPVVLAVSTLVASFVAGTTSATAPFKKAFDAKYSQGSDSEEFQSAIKKASCYVCHVKRKKKDVVNAYGWELATLIEGNAKDRVDAARKIGTDAREAEDAKLLEEFQAAMTKVETLKSVSGETYGDLFKKHILPGAEGERSIRE